MVETDSQLFAGHFLDFNRTVTVGNHTHGPSPGLPAQTGDTSLSIENLPPVVTNIAPNFAAEGLQQGPDLTFQIVTQPVHSLGHHHDIHPAGNHSFSFNVRPPAIGCWFFWRVW